MSDSLATPWTIATRLLGPQDFPSKNIMEWVAISFSRGSSLPRDWTHVSCIGRWVLYYWANREAPKATMHCAVLNCFSRVRLFATLETVGHQAPLSMRFSRQEYWCGLPCPPSGGLPNRDWKHASCVSCTDRRFFTTSATWDALKQLYSN